MKENLYTPNCIRTFTGIYFNVFEPTLEMICIEDIAHHLSQQPRFGGALPEFYSVAQHSYMCSLLANGKENQKAALLHDASEAYLIDIPSPVKQGLSNYKEIEDYLMMVISEKFGFEYPLSADVKKVDKEMLEIEWETLMIKNNAVGNWTDKQAEMKFLERFKELFDEK